MSPPPVTRFAPSPTGELHLGNARTALFNLLLARHSGGRFIVRIEDTDTERSLETHTEALLADLGWLGIEWDAGPDREDALGPYRQSQRGALYGGYFAQLERGGAVYPCFCTPLELELSRRAQLAAGKPPRYAGTCRELPPEERARRSGQGGAATLRFRVPAGARVEWVDLVHGPHGDRELEHARHVAIQSGNVLQQGIVLLTLAERRAHVGGARALLSLARKHLGDAGADVWLARATKLQAAWK